MYSLAPIFLIVAVALSAYGALIIAVVRDTLQVAGSKGKGFYRKTVLMISTLAGFVVLSVAIVADELPNLTLVQVCVCCALCSALRRVNFKNNNSLMCICLLQRVTVFCVREVAILWMIASILATLHRPALSKSEKSRESSIFGFETGIETAAV